VASLRTRRQIISPAHALLFLGNGAIQMGALILILGKMNRPKESSLNPELAVLYSGACWALGAGIFIMAYSFPIRSQRAVVPRHLHGVRPCWLDRLHDSALCI